jgi:hypothetical protein
MCAAERRASSVEEEEEAEEEVEEENGNEADIKKNKPGKLLHIKVVREEQLESDL